MSTAARLGVVVAAVVVLVVGFVVLGNSSDDSPTSPVADVVTQTTGAAAASAPTTSASSTAAAPAASAAPAEPTIVVRDGAARGGIRKLKFSDGDRVRFRVTSDKTAEVHVHGFDIAKDAGPGAPAEFSFPADIEGVYEVELEATGTQIAALEITP